MPKVHKPRSGSLQYWPRKRAKRIYPKFNLNKKQAKSILSGFVGYKAGMTTIAVKNTNPQSPAKNLVVSCPVTVIECPPLKVLGLRFYNRIDGLLSPSSFFFSTKLDKQLTRKISLPKKTKQTIPEKYDEVRLVVYTQPVLTGIGKKKPEVFEVNCQETQIDKLKELLEKDIKVSEIIESGQYIDVKAITKGKGLQGVIKRFGVSLKASKSEKKRRSVGNLGAWTPKKVSWTVAQAGQTGFHTRTDINKHVLSVVQDTKKEDQKQSFKKYGIVRSDCIIVKGSIPGPAKRLIFMEPAERMPKTKDVYEVVGA